MAVLRDNPYGRFNFTVEADGIQAHFAEVRLPTSEIEFIEYREGGERANEPRKITGLTKYSNLALKRGIAGSTELWQWFAATRDGNVQRRNVTVTLLKEDRQPVMTWRLRNCLPVKYIGPVFNARDCDIAIEEVELSVERVDIE